MVTRSAMIGATELAFGLNEILEVLVALVPGDFYKSMTTHADHRVWQDVYRPNTKTGGIYLKLTVIEDVLVISFKEL